MNFRNRFAITCAAVSLAITGSYAQESQQSGAKSNVPLQRQSQVFFRADKLVGRSAQSPVAQDLGKIQDIVFNPEKGIYGIIKAENDRLVALPWTLVTAVTDKAVVFNTSAEALASAPSFTDKEWSKLNQPQFTQQVNSHFKQGAMGGSASTQEQQSSGSSASSPQEQEESKPEPAQGSASSPGGSDSGTSTNSPSPTSGSSTNSLSQ